MRKATQPYCKLGADYLDRIRVEQRQRYFLERLEQLAVQGTVQHQVNVSPLPI
jgi:hypothetical protein